MGKRLWYAVLEDAEDTDWGTGSFDIEPAIAMAEEYDCPVIAVIEEVVDENGDIISNVCIDELHQGIDF